MCIYCTPIGPFVAHEIQGIPRAKLQSIARQPGEKILSYNRRFRETLVHLYAAGLRDTTKAAKIVKLMVGSISEVNISNITILVIPIMKIQGGTQEYRVFNRRFW